MKGTIQVSKSKDALKPRLKLFLSADIIGSTAYKQPFTSSGPGRTRKLPEENVRWVKVIQGYYRQAERSFLGDWTRLAATVGTGRSSPCGAAPRLWKTIGDEVVFWKEITGDLEIWLTLICWMRMVQQIRDEFEKEAPGLDVKCSVWTAGFPVRNKAVALTLDPDNPSELAALNAYYSEKEGSDTRRSIGSVDFIGPGIDVGFRLGGFASSKKMPISLDVAYLLSCTCKSFENFEDGLSRKGISLVEWFPKNTGQFAPNLEGKNVPCRLAVYFSGTEELKGVLGGIRYPKFWISTIKSESLDAAKDAFYGDRRPALKWPELENYCGKFYNDRERFIAKPFINNADSVTFQNLSEEHRAWQGELVKLHG